VKISYSTPIRDRLQHLKITLPVSLRENAGLDVEFIVSDSGSIDGLEEWIYSSFPSELESGLLKYFKTPASEFWGSSKEKNLAHSYSSGVVVCNLDADNLVTREFTLGAIETFERNINSILNFQGGGNMGGGCGRVALSAENFKALGGYDESFKDGWGGDDTDLIKRAIAFGVENVFEGVGSLLFLNHNNDLRGRYMKNKELMVTARAACDQSKENILNNRLVANLK